MKICQSVSKIHTHESFYTVPTVCSLINVIKKKKLKQKLVKWTYSFRYPVS